MLNKTLLLVGGSQILLDLTGKILKRLGYSVYCTGYDEAVEFLKGFVPDAVILERGLPNGMSFKLCRELSKEKTIPIMFLSDHNDDELPALQAGASDFLKKPFDFDVFKARLNVLIYSKASAGQANGAIDRIEPADSNAAYQHAAGMLAADAYAADTQPAYLQPADSQTADANGQAGTIAIGNIFSKLLPTGVIRTYAVLTACFLALLTGIELYYNSPRVAIGDTPIPLGSPSDAVSEAQPGALSKTRSIAWPEMQTVTPQGTLADSLSGDTGISQPRFDENARPYTDGGIFIKYPDFGIIKIPAGAKDVKMQLPNPDGNQCYFNYELVLAESGETLFASGLIEPGMCVEDITLSRTLDKGVYKASLRIGSYPGDDMSPTGCAVVYFYLEVV